MGWNGVLSLVLIINWSSHLSFGLSLALGMASPLSQSLLLFICFEFLFRVSCRALGLTNLGQKGEANGAFRRLHFGILTSFLNDKR